MKRALSTVSILGVLLLGAAPCESAEEAADATGREQGQQTGDAPQGGSAAGGAGGTGASTGGTGASAGGAGGASGTTDAGGAPACDLACPAHQHCELIDVQCIKAPCPPVPQCVDGAAGTACGSRGLSECGIGLYCQFAASADCGRADAPGTCVEKPEICTQQYAPVCGCDGKTYPSACVAAGAGVSVDREGECEAP